MKKPSIPFLSAALAQLFTLGVCSGTSGSEEVLAQNPQERPEASAPAAPETPE